MTSRSIREALSVQILDTERMLALIGDHPIMAPSFKQRILDLQKQLEKIPLDQKEAKVILFFSGKPVLGSEGIDVFFTGKVLPPFQNMVTADFAQRLKRKSGGGKEQIKKTKEAQMFITALPRGSFGLELTKLQSHNLFDETQLADTLLHITNVVDASAKSDDDFAVALEDISTKTITSLKDFLGVVSNAEAGVTIESGGVRCELSPEEARIAYNRVSATSTDENQITLAGTLRGATLDSWRFDFTPEKGNRFSGKISEDLSEERVKYFLENYLDINSLATFEISTIAFKKGRERITYQLLEIQGL